VRFEARAYSTSPGAPGPSHLGTGDRTDLNSAFAPSPPRSSAEIVGNAEPDIPLSADLVHIFESYGVTKAAVDAGIQAAK